MRNAKCNPKIFKGHAILNSEINMELIKKLKPICVVIVFFGLARICFCIPIQTITNNTQSINYPKILYDDAIDYRGLESLVKLRAVPRYLVIYQNNCDPEAQKTGEINPDNIIKEIIRLEGNTPEGWGVLDFESPFDDWIHKGVDSPECKKAVKTMVNAIRQIKKRFPNMKWTYYGLPGLLYYLGDYNWANAPDGLKQEEITRQLAMYGPIMDECDWLSPCCYDTVGDGKGGIRPLPNQIISTRAWHAARTKMCVDYVRSKGRDCPVIPFVSPLYMPGGGSRVFSVIPNDVMVNATIQPVIESGAMGVAIWTSGTTFIERVTGVRKNDGFTEGGGVSTMIKHWSEDLKLTPDQIQKPDSVPQLRTMISNSVVEMATETIRIWNQVHPQTQNKVP